MDKGKFISKQHPPCRVIIIRKHLQDSAQDVVLTLTNMILTQERKTNRISKVKITSAAVVNQHYKAASTTCLLTKTNGGKGSETSNKNSNKLMIKCFVGDGIP